MVNPKVAFVGGLVTSVAMGYLALRVIRRPEINSRIQEYWNRQKTEFISGVNDYCLKNRSQRNSR